MALNMAGDERNLQPGDAYAIPGGVPHRAIGGPNGCLVLDAFNPPREEYLERADRQRRQNKRISLKGGEQDGSRIAR